MQVKTIQKHLSPRKPLKLDGSKRKYITGSPEAMENIKQNPKKDPIESTISFNMKNSLTINIYPQRQPVMPQKNTDIHRSTFKHKYVYAIRHYNRVKINKTIIKN